MRIEKLAEYKERIKIETEKGNIKEAEKYYKLFLEGYKELIGEDFEDIINKYKNIEKIEK